MFAVAKIRKFFVIAKKTSKTLKSLKSLKSLRRLMVVRSGGYNEKVVQVTNTTQFPAYYLSFAGR